VIDAMVRELFRGTEQDPVPQVLERSLAVLTSENIRSVLRETAWSPLASWTAPVAHQGGAREFHASRVPQRDSSKVGPAKCSGEASPQALERRACPARRHCGASVLEISRR